MRTLYMNTANSTTGGTALEAQDTDIIVKRIIVGNPVASANVWFYNESNVGNVTNTTGLVSKLTLPASFATGQLPYVMDFGIGGLPLSQGGTVAIDQALQLTVVFALAAQDSNVT